MRSLKTSLQAIDLFSGGGGLSVGLKRAGFSVVAAIEAERESFTTYKRNHPETHCFNGDIRDLRRSDLNKITEGRLDLLAGCPPCQGFTSLTSKYRREDPRNCLIYEMLRLCLEIKPRAIMLENVPQLATKGKKLFADFVSALEASGYICNYSVLQAADFGVPQSRKRLVFVAGHEFEIDLPQPTHSQYGEDKPKWIPVKSVFGGLGKPKTLADSKASNGPQSEGWHIVRSLSQENIDRLRCAQPGHSWQKIPEHLRPRCHRGDYKGFSNVYGRMNPKEVSPTITGGCTTLSKGRFGHPTATRTISVREAARIQTFPDEYVFATDHMEAVSTMIGNAFPCLFAQRIAEAVRRALDT